MAASDPPDLPITSFDNRVKLLCSFGGSILPRPLDGRLRYVGGETRIVSLPRDVGYDDLMARMRELFEEDGPFVLKYQQPDEDLDALVSVVNDDDVTNMMEEHDKLGVTGDGFVRLRVFLFPPPDQGSSSVIRSHFDDDRESERRYVDALNCVSDANPQSPDWDGARTYQLGGLNRLAIPRRPSHGQLYGDVDGSWSPAAYYSPGQVTPQDYREFSPSPGQIHEYEHPSPFVDGGSLVWVPPGGAVSEMAGFPGNLGHSHGSIYDGNGGCEQCRMALQRAQDAHYYDARGMPYGQFHPEQPGEVCGTQFVNSCPECVRQREGYLMNPEMPFDHEHFDRHTFYNDFHVRDRNWIPHLHELSHHHEEMRAGRNHPQHAIDGNATNLSSTHSGLYNGNSVSNCIGHLDSRYAYVGHEQGSEYSDPHRALPPLRIPRQEEGGMRYANVAPSYGTTNNCQAPDRASLVHGSRRNIDGLVGTAPVFELQPGLVQTNDAANVGYPRDALEGQALAYDRAADILQSPFTGHSGNMAHINFPIEGVTFSDYAIKSNFKTPNQENLLASMHGPVQVRAVGGDHDNNGETEPSSYLPLQFLDRKGVDPSSLGSSQFTQVAGQSETVTANNFPGEANTKERHSYSSTELEANKKKQHSLTDNLTTSNSQLFHGNENGSHPNETKECAIECLGMLPGLIASVEHIALESINDGKDTFQADPVADASSSQQVAQEISHRINMEQTDACKDADVDSDTEQADDFKIESTTAEKEALAKGLQAIQNDDLEEIRELGSGAYGSVFHGKWKGTDVAIKRIKASCFSGKPSERERLISDFWKEAQILSSLHHPNVVAFYGVVRNGPDGTLATVTEFMVNGSLKQFLQKKDRTIDRRKRLIIAMDAAFGMEYLHGKNIVHFDLKCENLLVNMRDPHRPICKIGDLGLSKVKQKTLVSGGVRGTLPWMAPELLSGKSKMVTEKVDVYSFGVVMWELLTGEDPYADMHCASIIGGIVNCTLRPQIPSWCDPEWKSLMESCWSSEPSERPSFLEISLMLRKMAAAMNLK